MRLLTLRLAGTIVTILLTAASSAWAQRVGQVVGTLSELRPVTIEVRSAPSGELVRYVSSQTTVYVDQTGAPLLSVDLLKAGVPIIVDYIKVADQMVASRVILSKSPPAVPAEEKKAATIK
jgi:hypothetical protein